MQVSQDIYYFNTPEEKRIQDLFSFVHSRKKNRCSVDVDTLLFIKCRRSTFRYTVSQHFNRRRYYLKKYRARIQM